MIKFKHIRKGKTVEFFKAVNKGGGKTMKPIVMGNRPLGHYLLGAFSLLFGGPCLSPT
jgi:hypothetical protein